MSVKILTEIISPYFTGDVLNNILKKTSGLNDVKIDKIDFGGETKKGDSYLSTMTKFTAHATGTNEEGQPKKFSLPVIVKSIPKNVARRKTYHSGDFFATEIVFYKKVWPEMQKFKNSKNLPDELEVPPLLSAYSDGLNDYVALEDFTYKNYRCLTRDDGLDYDVTVMLLKKMANFHAISIAYLHQNPEFAKTALQLKETYFAEKYRTWYSKFQQNLFPLFRNAVQKKLPAMYLEKLNSLYETDLFGALCRFCEIRNSPLSAVTHGDTWIPNFLIQFDGDTPVHSILIDFQLARFTTVSSDISFFLYACVAEDVLLTKWDQLLEEYHTALTSRIQALGSPADLITLDMLKEDMQKNALLGVGMSMEAIPIASLGQEEVVDLDLLQGEEAVPIDKIWIIPPFKDDARNDRLAFLIKHAVDKGFIP